MSLYGAGSYSYSPACAAPSAKDHSFDIRVANQVGVTAAIIHANITYWIEGNWKRAAGDVMEKLNLADFDNAHAMEAFAFAHNEPKAACHRRVLNWANEHTYLKPRSVERAFATLIAEGLLVCKPKHRIPVWFLAKNDRAEFLASMLDDKELTVAIRQKTPQFSAKKAISAPKGQLHRQKGNLTAKRASKQDLSDSSEEGCDATKKLHTEALALRALLREKPTRKTTSRSVASRADALPAGTATNAAAPPLTLLEDKEQEQRRERSEQVREQLNTPPTESSKQERLGEPLTESRAEFRKRYREQLSKLPPETQKAIQPHRKVKTPWVEPVVRKDEFGNVVKRQYIRRALPAKLDLEDYFDLTAEQRKAYDALEDVRCGTQSGEQNSFTEERVATTAQVEPVVGCAPKAQAAGHSRPEANSKLAAHSKQYAATSQTPAAPAIRNPEAPKRGRRNIN